MLDADSVINNSSQKVGGFNAYPDPAPEKWVGPDAEKYIGSTPLVGTARHLLPPVGLLTLTMYQIKLLGENTAKSFSGRRSVRTPLGEHTALPQTSLLVRRG